MSVTTYLQGGRLLLQRSFGKVGTDSTSPFSRDPVVIARSEAIFSVPVR